ncbi:MAG: hypothetical protein RO009_22265 [Pseudorhodoplanes sp.]|nr:hypothetical protein [Pseudorhodoplanes sp.]
MPRIHVLTAGFETPNGRAFLFPLVVWRRELREAGFDVRFFNHSAADVTDCDVLLVDSKFHRDRWVSERNAVLGEFARLAEKCRVVYCDTTDSSGSLQADLLPAVHVYGKAQVLADRSHYLRPLYGQRLYADYYHRTLGIEDATPEWSVPVRDKYELEKIRVSWNSGLANYSLHGPARMALYHRLPLPGLLQFPQPTKLPSAPRQQGVSCRFGTDYPRATVAIQRKMIRDKLAGRIDTRKLSRREYFHELESSKLVVSPFGYGEITLKDFEVFLTGGLLLKPDMAHMETWPDFFRGGETMLAHRWDLSDFETQLEDAVTNYARHAEKALRGQEAYRAHTSGPDAPALFMRHLRNLIAPTTGRPQ